MLHIRVRRIGAEDGKVTVSPGCSISNLKSVVSAATGVAVDRQRLIFRGQVLSNDQDVTSYSIDDGVTIHLIERVPRDAISTTDSDESQYRVAQNFSNGTSGAFRRAPNAHNIQSSSYQSEANLPNFRPSANVVLVGASVENPGLQSFAGPRPQISHTFRSRLPVNHSFGSVGTSYSSRALLRERLRSAYESYSRCRDSTPSDIRNPFSRRLYELEIILAATSTLGRSSSETRDQAQSSSNHPRLRGANNTASSTLLDRIDLVKEKLHAECDPMDFAKEAVDLMKGLVNLLRTSSSFQHLQEDSHAISTSARNQNTMPANENSRFFPSEPNPETAERSFFMPSVRTRTHRATRLPSNGIEYEQTPTIERRMPVLRGMSQRGYYAPHSSILPSEISRRGAEVSQTNTAGLRVSADEGTELGSPVHSVFNGPGRTFVQSHRHYQDMNSEVFGLYSLQNTSSNVDTSVERHASRRRMHE